MGIALTLVVSTTAVARDSSRPVCGPDGVTTIRTEGRTRIYTVTRIAYPKAPNPFEEELAFACLEPAGQPRLLASISSGLSAYRGRRVGFTDLDTLALHRPRAAFAWTVSGIDTSKVFVVTLNLRTNIRVRCLIGGRFLAKPGPSVAKIAIAAKGQAVWVKELARSSEIEVETCSRDGEVVVLDHGSGIDAQSLAVHGARASWLNEGEQRSASLE